ncbi:MAG: hypothetical protein U9Q69_00460 [Nanoarchaeota archaeon]|nr:hypothetical protein [Nanoarchaeota archaeon]
MRTSYWFLFVFSFLIALSVLFLLWPLVNFLLGLLIGLISVSFEVNTAIADFFIHISRLTWRLWPISLILSLVISGALVLFTHKVRYKAAYKRMKIK